MEKNLTGIILKGIGGFYYVEVSDSYHKDSNGQIYMCTARGRFRKEKFTPLAGDRVVISPAQDMTGTVDEILTRKNFLNRPPVANIDRLFIVVSVVEPYPDMLVLDKTIACAELRDIEPIVVITKTDIKDGDHIKQIYESAGIKCILAAYKESRGIGEIENLLKGNVCAFTGNSGVGKSTLLNAIYPDFNLKTGEISKKLGRGRHTTREVELYKLKCGGYVADTPGFSTVDIELSVTKETLASGFREFLKYADTCKFISCAHTCEKGCQILDAVGNGKINKSRHDSYVAMYNEIKDIKQWEKSKNA